MPDIDLDAPGTSIMLMGNEAIARGALEAGVGVAAAYPGTPSSDILGSIAPIAKRRGMYAEWSVNELVSMEVAAAAALAGVRAMVAMKMNGVNTICDFLATGSGQSVGAGLVLVSADDPGPLYSPSETDSRGVCKWLDIPLIEPGDFQECKDMTKWCFELSEELDTLCMLRTVGKVSHGRGDVKLGELPKLNFKPHYKRDRTGLADRDEAHTAIHQKFEKALEIFEKSPYNYYVGPDKPELLIITCGTGWIYSKEVVPALKLEKRVGILKLGTLHPLPVKLVTKYLNKSPKVLFVEEVDPFLEQSVNELIGSTPSVARPIIYGKHSKHIPSLGDIGPDLVSKVLASIMEVTYQPRDIEYEQKIAKARKTFNLSRKGTWCPGCWYRPAYWAVKNALKMDGREGFISPDIGCYGSTAFGPAGYDTARVHYCMGGAVGVGSGFGILWRFGDDQPALVGCGDSTFFHAEIPGLINAVYQKANMLMVVFDNTATSMTGFQPHPGTGMNAMGEPAPKISIGAICKAIGCYVETCEPFDIKTSTETIVRLLKMEGVKVLIFQRECELIRARKAGPPYKMYLDSSKCLGNTCECDRLCVRLFLCSALRWNDETGKTEIDDVLCAGCGACADICPHGAITKEPTAEKKKELEEVAGR